MAATERLALVDPETGEVVDLHALSDGEIDELHLHLVYLAREYDDLERFVWSEIRRRAVANGGLQGSKRRWVVARVATAQAEFLEGKG